jgi:CheY-like chemotaxis protein
VNCSDCITADSAPLDITLPGWRGFVWELSVPGESAGPNHPARYARENASTHPRGNGEVVLVVDDEITIRGILTDMLERYGYRVLTARHGAEALSIYAQHTAEIAVVLTDMMMPVMDGPATVRAIRQIKPDAKVIGMSGARLGSARSAEVELPHFIPKPYTAELVLQTLSRVLRGE